MKGEFSHSIDLENLANYCLKGGWLGLEQGWTREGLIYRTLSGSAKMTLTPNQGVYEGQHSLLFSHAVFAWVTRGWFKGEIEFDSWTSSTSQHPMEYWGRCYMKGLRQEVAQKFLLVSEMDIRFHEIMEKWKIMDRTPDKAVQQIFYKDVGVIYKDLLVSRGEREKEENLKGDYEEWRQKPPIAISYRPFEVLEAMRS